MMCRPRYSFPRSRRLTNARQYQAVYDARVSVRTGPLLVHGRPNQLEHCRLGLAIGKRAGNAVTRNRIKRLLRESFRLTQHDLYAAAGAYDLIISVRQHEPLQRGAYENLLLDAVRRLDGIWTKRAAKITKIHKPPNPPAD